MQCLCLWSSKRSGTLYALCIRSVGVQWSQMLIEYAAGPEGENNKCLKHFSQNNVEFHILCHLMHFVKIVAIKCPVEVQPTCKSDIWVIRDFFLSLWSCWAGIAVCRFYWAWYCRPICNAKSFWLTSLSKKCVVGHSLLLNKMQIQFAMRAKCRYNLQCVQMQINLQMQCTLW